MNRFVRLSALITLAFLLICSPFPSHASPAVSLTILHVNDLHGYILPFEDKTLDPDSLSGGAAYLAQIIERERFKNPEGTLLLAAGDMFQGTPISNIFRGRPVIEIMNLLRFEAMAIGNHEFDWGREALSELIAAANFPFLSANITDTQGRPIQGTRPYIILTRKNVRIAIIGVTTTETAYTTKPANVSDLVFSHPEKILPDVISEVRSQGAGLVIILSHLGFDADRELAAKVRGIDVIVGGHSHTAVTRPVNVGETLVVQAGYYGLYLGVLELKYDTSTGKVVGYGRDSGLRRVSAAPGSLFDEDVSRIVEKYHRQIKAEYSRIVGSTSVDLTKSPDRESNIGNLICDSMIEATGANIAFQNSGGIRSDISKGDITLEEAFDLLPFDNTLVVMDLTGHQILQLLEQNAGGEQKILQVAGLKVEYDLSRPPGARVLRVLVAEDPLRDTQVYRVVTNDFLAVGGDRFDTFTQGTNIVYGDPMRDVFIHYLSKHSPVRPEIDGRIIFLNP